MQRVGHRGVVGERDEYLRALHLAQRGGEPAGGELGVLDERFHLPLTEGRAAFAGEPAAESLHTGHSELAATGMQHFRAAFEHFDTRITEQRCDLFLSVAVVIVVAEHREHRDVEVTELFGDDLRLVDPAVPGEVASEQQYIGPLGNAGQRGAQRALDVRRQVYVPDGRDPHAHRSSSLAPGCPAGTTRGSLRICRPGVIAVSIRAGPPSGLENACTAPG